MAQVTFTRLTLHRACLLLVIIFTASQSYADALATHAQVETLARTQLMWNQQPLPAYTTGKPEISILKFTIPAGAQLPLHRHPYANAGVILSGVLSVYTEQGETRHLQAGDALIELVNIPHYGINNGDSPTVVVVFYAGEADQAVTELVRK